VKQKFRRHLMGLDMYLTKKTYIGAKYEHREVTGTVEISVRGEKLPIDFNRIMYIEEEAGYWRKANAIHAWFVENVQGGEDDCKQYYVSRDNMQRLLETVNLVLENSELVKGVVSNGKQWTLEDGWKEILDTGEVLLDTTVAERMLPSQSGFFFGSTDYDEYYVQDLRDTKEIIEKALAEQGDYYYESSW